MPEEVTDLFSADTVPVLAQGLSETRVTTEFDRTVHAWATEVAGQQRGARPFVERLLHTHRHRSTRISV